MMKMSAVPEAQIESGVGKFEALLVNVVLRLHPHQIFRGTFYTLDGGEFALLYAPYTTYPFRLLIASGPGTALCHRLPAYLHPYIVIQIKKRLSLLQR